MGFAKLNNGGSSVGVDTTAANAINVTCEWDTADASKIMATMIGSIEIVN